MKLSELIEALEDIRSKIGEETDVFVGSFYKDIAIDSVVIEDGYPLILIDGYKDAPLEQF